MKYLPHIVLAGFLAFFIWNVEVRGIQALILQHQAESFAQVQGEVLASEVTVTHGSKGAVYHHVQITYRYSVDAFHYYTGRRYRYDGHPTDAAGAHAAVQAHPPHAMVTVYYNPANPADTVLSPGVDNRDVLQLFMMTPIILLFLGLLGRAGAQTGWPWSTVAVAGGVKLIEERGLVTRVRLPKYQAWMIGLIAVGILLEVAAILMACGITSGPPLSVGGELLLGVLLVGAAIYGWQRQKIATGQQDLVIDEGSRTFELPLTYKRRERRPLPISQIKAVTLEKVPHRGRYGSVTYTYAPTLQMQDGTAECLTDLPQSRAESLAGWLREKLGVSESWERQPETRGPLNIETQPLISGFRSKVEFGMSVFLFAVMGMVPVSLLVLLLQSHFGGPEHPWPHSLILPMMLAALTPGFLFGLWFARKQARKQFWRLTDTELTCGISRPQSFPLAEVEKVIVGLPARPLSKLFQPTKPGTIGDASVTVLSTINPGLDAVRNIYQASAIKGNSLLLCFKDGSRLPLRLFLLPNGNAIMDALKERFKDRLDENYNYSVEEIRKLRRYEVNELIPSAEPRPGISHIRG